MTDLDLERVPDIVQRYCYWLFNSSKDFKLEASLIRAKASIKPLPSGLDQEITDLCHEYEVPEKFHYILANFIISGTFASSAIQTTVVTHDMSIEVKAPAIAVVFSRKVTPGLLKNLGRQLELLQQAMPEFNLSPVFTSIEYRQRANFDRDFKWYKWKKSGLSYLVILKKMVAKMEPKKARALSQTVIEKAVQSLSHVIDEMKELAKTY